MALQTCPVHRQGFDRWPRIRVWGWYSVLLVRSLVLETILGQFLSSGKSAPRGEESATPAGQTVASLLQRGGRGQITVWKCFVSDNAERHGSNYRANTHRNMKTCVFSLHPPLPLFSPLPRPPWLSEWWKARHLCVYTCTHSLRPCLLFLITCLCNEIGSNCFCVRLRKESYHLVFFIPDTEGNGLGLRLLSWK